MTDETKARLTAMLDEYKTLRDECKQASINMFAALQIGAGFVGIVLAAAFAQWGRSAAVGVFVFLVLVPLLASFSMLIWLGEAIRFKRAGDYICFLEQKISLLLEISAPADLTFNELMAALQHKAESSLGFVRSPLVMKDPLTWEQWLRNTRGRGIKARLFGVSGHQWLVYLVRLGFFPLIMVLSYLVGVYYASRYPPSASISPIRFMFMELPTDYVLVAQVIGGIVIIASLALGAIISITLNKRAGVIQRDEPTGSPEEN